MYTITGYPHNDIGHAPIEVERETYEEARTEANSMLSAHSIIKYVMIYEDGKFVSKHY